MCIAHGDFEIGVTKNSLQSENIPAVNQEVTCERMPQNVSELPIWQFDTGTLDRLSKRPLQ